MSAQSTYSKLSSSRLLSATSSYTAVEWRKEWGWKGWCSERCVFSVCDPELHWYVTVLTSIVGVGVQKNNAAWLHKGVSKYCELVMSVREVWHCMTHQDLLALTYLLLSIVFCKLVIRTGLDKPIINVTVKITLNWETLTMFPLSNINDCNLTCKARQY